MQGSRDRRIHQRHSGLKHPPAARRAFCHSRQNKQAKGSKKRRKARRAPAKRRRSADRAPENACVFWNKEQIRSDEQKARAPFVISEEICDTGMRSRPAAGAAFAACGKTSKRRDQKSAVRRAGLPKSANEVRFLGKRSRPAAGAAFAARGKTSKRRDRRRREMHVF